MTRIIQATSPEGIETIRELFTEYADTLGIDLCFQGFEAELADLPGDYAPPRGVLLLAVDDAGVALGCVGLRPLEWPLLAELKRLYVRPQARGRGLGATLSRAVLSAALDVGYERVRLDTLSSMEAARRVYEELGFREIDAYCFNPIEGARYMELILRSKAD